MGVHYCRINSVRCESFSHGPIGSWDVSAVTLTDMNELFSSSSSSTYGNMIYDPFKADLSKWNVSSVTKMSAMFAQATKFNSDISKWDVSRAITMSSMFRSALSFNADLSKWDVSSVTNMDHMFYSARSFKSDLTKWNVGRVDDADKMFTGSNVSKLCSTTWINFGQRNNHDGNRYGMNLGGTSPIDATSDVCQGLSVLILHLMPYTERPYSHP